ncbi:phage tail protein [Azotobacter chroococcum]|uniref:phage tail protein n=1 Tax=Azotobacter chroococcum TaxID=353 RepID=UPI0010AEBA52|nr:phage tail protein [Azotobacter chroococcum]TKD40697.1 phage tail protein [Azotobacter chroococcum]
MATLIDILSQAAAGGVRAAEQAQKAARSAEAGQIAGATVGAAAIIGSLDDAAVKLGSVSGRLAAGELDSAGSAAVGRSLRALAVAETALDTGIARVVASTVGSTLGPGLQAALTEFGAALGLTRRAAGVAGQSVSGAQPVPVSSLAIPGVAIPSAATSAQPHLLVLSADNGERYYFGLGTAAYETLKRTTSFNVAAQERLQRPEALQAVSQGGETISVSGAIFTKTKAGARQLDTLRRIGAALLPLQLTTGYGDVLGRWYLTQIDEEQGALMPDGAPRKQTFTLEFRRYGDDFANR